MSPTEEEQKLLRILNEPELPSPAGDNSNKNCELDAEAAVRSAYPELGSKAQKVMASILGAEMPTPEELEQAERIAQHNAELSRKRKERLNQRKLRQEARQAGKKRDQPRRRSHRV